MFTLALAVAGSMLLGFPPDSHDSPPADVREAGLRGLIFDQGRWVSPDEIVLRETGDGRLARLRAEYETRRERASGTAEGQRKLALWCEQAGLKAESLAHFLAVTRLDPADVDAAQRLGMRFDKGSWRSDAEIAAETVEAEAQARADRLWTPKFATWRKWLVDPDRKDEAVKALAEVRDPRAIPALRLAFRDDDSWEQSWTVNLLGRIDAPRSSQVLAEISVFGVDDKVRLTALRKLVGRDPRTFVGLLINWLRKPIRYEVGTRGVSEVLRVEGSSAIIERSYKPILNDGSTIGATGRNAGSDALKAMNREMLRAIRDRERGDIRALERANYLIEKTNLRVERTLKGVTGIDLGTDPQPWTIWWTHELGYYYESPKSTEPMPVIQEHVSVVYTPPPPPAAPLHHSCFGAGTPVLTRMGVRPIEDLRVGDQVLTQIPTTGQLAFRPILTIFHNKPSATLRVELEDETIVATGIHRFWKAGEGWTMARDLRPGDRVRTLGGPSEVVKVVRDQVQPVYNLEVADGHSFFVGRNRALVHDNSLVIPTTAPFDALPVAVSR